MDRHAGDEAAEPVSLHDHAIEQLTFIRSTVERAGSFSAVPGRETMIIGVSALIAAFVGSRQFSREHWFLVWMVEACLASSLSGIGIVRKARRQKMLLASAVGRRFALAFLPPLVAGGVLTAFLYDAGMVPRLPGIWLLLYGTSLVCGGALSMRVVPLTGFVFILLGAAALIAPPSQGDAFMAVGFGVVHLIFGFVIARWYGG